MKNVGMLYLVNQKNNHLNCGSPKGYIIFVCCDFDVANRNKLSININSRLKLFGSLQEVTTRTRESTILTSCMSITNNTATEMTKTASVVHRH